MLGNYTKGMVVKIQARFRSGDKLLPVENAVVRIEHYDDALKQVVHDLPETAMKQLSPSDYEYDFTIPANMKNGMYSVNMATKIPQNGYKVFEAWEQFSVISSDVIDTAKDETIVTANEIAPPKINNSYEYYNNQQPDNVTRVLEDVVVDIENEPIKGVHVNVYLKNDFMPNDQNNVKMASTMTDKGGRWSVNLPIGEYVVVFKGIGFKENREFRKVL